MLPWRLRHPSNQTTKVSSSIKESAVGELGYRRVLLGTPNGPLCKLLAMAACSGPRLFQNASMRTNLYTQQTTHGSLLTDLARAVPPVQNCIDMPGKFAPPSSCWSQLRWHARWIMQKRSATVPCRRNRIHINFGTMQKEFSHCPTQRKACSRTSRHHA